MFLAILFWLLLIFAAIGIFGPEPWRPWANKVSLILFAILGYKAFGFPPA